MPSKETSGKGRMAESRALRDVDRDIPTLHTELAPTSGRDCAEQDQLLDFERTARAEAERVGHLKDEFLANLSHELRTPINAILGWSQLIKPGESTTEDLAEAMEVIKRNARLQARLIDDLLDMSRVVSGKMRLDVQRVDLQGVIEMALESVRPAADAKNIRIEKIIDPLAAPVTGDPAAPCPDRLEHPVQRDQIHRQGRQGADRSGALRLAPRPLRQRHRPRDQRRVPPPRLRPPPSGGIRCPSEDTQAWALAWRSSKASPSCMAVPFA